MALDGQTKLLERPDDPELCKRGIKIQRDFSASIDPTENKLLSHISTEGYDQWLLLNGIKRMQAAWRGKCTRAAMASIVDFRSIGRTFRYEI